MDRFTEVGVIVFRALAVEGQNLRYCGTGTGYDSISIDGNLDELKVWDPFVWGANALTNGDNSSSRTT